MADNTNIDPIVLPEEQAGPFIGRSKRAMFNLRKSGRIPYIRNGSRIGYLVNDLKMFVEQNKVTDTPMRVVKTG